MRTGGTDKLSLRPILVLPIFPRNTGFFESILRMGATVSKVWLIYTLRDRETEPVAIKLKISIFSNFCAQINGQIAGPGGKFAQKARTGPVVWTQIPLSAKN